MVIEFKICRFGLELILDQVTFKMDWGVAILALEATDRRPADSNPVDCLPFKSDRVVERSGLFVVKNGYCI